MNHRAGTTRTLIRVATALTLVALVCIPGGRAHAVAVGTPVVTLSDGFTNTTNVTYTFSGYTVGNGQMIVAAEVTFPAGTDVSGATAVSPAGTRTVSGQTVRVDFTTPVPRGAAFSWSIGGIRNPATAGTYNAGNITFYPVNPANNNPRNPESHPTADYTFAQPYLTLSVDPSTVSFDLMPGVTAGPEAITVNVDSSHPYTITRTVGGSHDLFGLQVTGSASGSKPAGSASYAESLTATAPWTTEGDRTYTATVTYTVVNY